MVKYRVGATARAQLVQILIRSAYDYGDRHADNYLLLLQTAMEDVASEPGRAGARPLRRLREVWSYDTRYSRNRVPRDRRVRDPWHKLIYTLGADGVVEILAIVGRSYPSGRAAGQALARP
jgi:toxin ParE1/3/4